MWSTVGFRIAQAMGITGAAWLSGNIALFSMNVVPSLLRSRTEVDLSLTTLVTQWREIYETGKRQNPPIAGLTAASFIYLAIFSSRKSSSPPPLLFRGGTPYSRTGFYASAALLTLSIVPFTLIAMSSTNNALIDVSESQKQRGTGTGAAAVVATDGRIEELLQDWVALNRVRSLLPLLASLTGIAVALL